ncbi:hypothetical protein Tco_0820075 [Tanacetum coccineum]|uniref:Uncharacterized protein n=1 Tax=Tanacetum coccineum TaxID=301880 RepID=A0ABQ5ACQ3_9ASTR
MEWLSYLSRESVVSAMVDPVEIVQPAVEGKEFLDKRKKLQDFETELTNVSQADASGVATEMVTLNATIKFNFRNRGTFFGVHVPSTIVDLAHTELTLATGSIKKFYQSRKGHRIVSVNVRGVGVPYMVEV